MTTFAEVIEELELDSVVDQVEEEEEEEQQMSAGSDAEGGESGGTPPAKAQAGAGGARPSGRASAAGGGAGAGGPGGGEGDGDDDEDEGDEDEDDDEREARRAQEERDQQTQQEEAQQRSAGPVGQGDYIVHEGDCISSIAKEYGHFWETIWNDAANSELKSVRKDPNVLLPGDRVTIPEIEPKQESGATEEHHRFRRKGEPAMLRLQFVGPPQRDDDDEAAAEQDETRQEAGDWTVVEQQAAQSEPEEDEPRADVPYVLTVDGERFSGTTDADGKVEVEIPGNARRAEITLNPGTEAAESYPVRLGHLSPISEVVGVKQRLGNLAFECGDRSDEETPGLVAALRGFQAKHGLQESGEIDEATRNKLLEVHGI